MHSFIFGASGQPLRQVAVPFHCLLQHSLVAWPDEQSSLGCQCVRCTFYCFFCLLLLHVAKIQVHFSRKHALQMHNNLMTATSLPLTHRNFNECALYCAVERVSPIGQTGCVYAADGGKVKRWLAVQVNWLLTMCLMLSNRSLLFRYYAKCYLGFCGKWDCNIVVVANWEQTVCYKQQ